MAYPSSAAPAPASLASLSLSRPYGGFGENALPPISAVRFTDREQSSSSSSAHAGPSTSAPNRLPSFNSLYGDVAPPPVSMRRSTLSSTYNYSNAGYYSGRSGAYGSSGSGGLY